MTPGMLQKPRRVPFLDELRGFDLLLMIVYHGCYDLVYLFGVNMPAFHRPAFYYFQQFICSVFILLSGACCRYSRSNLKRGLQTFGVAMLFTAATWLVMPGQLILFGILHFLGCAMMLFALLEPLLDRVPAFWGLVLMLVLFLLLRPLTAGSVGLPGMAQVPVPQLLYDLRYLFFLGFPGQGFYSADYFPILPWLPLFLAGSYLGVFFARDAMPRALYRSHAPMLAAVGRRSLLIYVLHQPLLFAILSAFFWVKSQLF